MGEITKTVEFSHPVAKVWRVLTTPELLALWLAPNDFEACLGHRFQFKMDPAPGFDGIVDCEVVELEEPHRLAYSWVGGPIDTVVSYSLERSSSGSTRLTLKQEGFRGLQAKLVRRILSAGWTKMGRDLADVLDRLAEDGVLALKPPQPESSFVLWRMLSWAFTPLLKNKDKADKADKS